MSKTRLVITAVVIQNRPVAQVAAEYGVSRSWLYELLARYRTEGDAVFEPRSRRPKHTPNATPADVVELIVELREKLTATGLDSGPDTIRWHLAHHHAVQVSRTTITRHLQAHGLVVPEPKKKPKSSYIRFAAAMPNETWQADFTHYRLTKADGRPGADCEILTWLDDCSRYALSVTAHVRVTGPIVLAAFRQTVAEHGIPASTLTDNGMVFTTRLSGGSLRGTRGRNGLEHELRRLGVVQKNSRPNHPTTCGKVERFQQTLKKWLRAQPDQPTTIDDLQALIDAFVEEYNDHRPHRSLEHRATPAAVYTHRPKASPADGARTDDTHDRLRKDRVDKSGKITLRYQGQLYSIGIGRTHARTRVIVLVQDRDIRIIDATTGELLRELTLDPSTRYQPIRRPGTTT
jgi:transposase InsO family protein